LQPPHEPHGQHPAEQHDVRPRDDALPRDDVRPRTAFFSTRRSRRDAALLKPRHVLGMRGWAKLSQLSSAHASTRILLIRISFRPRHHVPGTLNHSFYITMVRCDIQSKVAIKLTKRSHECPRVDANSADVWELPAIIEGLDQVVFETRRTLASSVDESCMPEEDIVR